MISPRIQAKLLPDYLKNNYLEGQALEIVKEIDDIEKIWERLRVSFGNVAILLHDKLGEIEKGLPLWKIKSDEKLVKVLIKLINGLKELSILAENHKIEGNLYHSSNFGKVYDLVGRKRQLEFMKQNLGKELTIKEEWQKMNVFLNNELRLKEEILMLDKSRLGKDTTLPKDGEEKRKVYNCLNHISALDAHFVVMMTT